MHEYIRAVKNIKPCLVFLKNDIGSFWGHTVLIGGAGRNESKSEKNGKW